MEALSRLRNNCVLVGSRGVAQHPAVGLGSPRARGVPPPPSSNSGSVHAAATSSLLARLRRARDRGAPGGRPPGGRRRAGGRAVHGAAGLPPHGRPDPRRAALVRRLPGRRRRAARRARSGHHHAAGDPGDPRTRRQGGPLPGGAHQPDAVEARGGPPRDRDVCRPRCRRPGRHHRPRPDADGLPRLRPRGRRTGGLVRRPGLQRTRHHHAPQLLRRCPAAAGPAPRRGRGPVRSGPPSRRSRPTTGPPVR